MSVHTYTRKRGHGSRDFATKIQTALAGDFRVACAADTVITFESDLTRDEETTLDGIISGYSPLDQIKQQRKALIDARTVELMNVFFATGDGTQAAITVAGVALRAEVDASVTETAVDSVTDDRS